MSQRSNWSTWNKGSVLVVTLAMLAALSGLAMAEPVGSLSDALGVGTLSLNLRYRMEMVSQDGLTDDAAASTARVRLGYQTESWKSLSGFAEIEALSSVGDANYNDTENGNVSYPVVADRQDAELNQAYVSFSGIENTSIIAGRQRLILDNARFIGNVGWRQNEQTFDVASIAIAASDNVNMFYAHVENVNRIFGANHPTDALANTDVSAELINVSFSSMPGKLTGYMYMIGLTDSPTASHQNLGVRFAGERTMSPLTTVTYSAEWAKQSGYKDGLSTIDATYYHVSVGAKLLTTSITAGMESLGGDGTWSFVTPLATLHKFNGWSDQFLTTPVNGLGDTYLSLGGSISALNWSAVYHDFNSDVGGLHYGSEIGFQLSRTFTSLYSLQFKYAKYSADTYGADTRKIWTSMTVKI